MLEEKIREYSAVGICPKCHKKFQKKSSRQVYCEPLTKVGSCGYQDWLKRNKQRCRVRRGMSTYIPESRVKKENGYHFIQSNCFKIYIPHEYGDEEGVVHYVPFEALEHKQYPKCRCGRYFVPIHKGDKICFYCQFTDGT